MQIKQLENFQTTILQLRHSDEKCRLTEWGLNDRELRLDEFSLESIAHWSSAGSSPRRPVASIACSHFICRCRTMKAT